MPIALTAAFLLAGGCALGPRFKTPAVDAPLGFLGQGVVSQQVTMANLPWWKVFADDTLHELVRTALTNNYEVLEAQQQLFPAENNLAQTQLDRLTSVIQLYKVLGGE